MKAKEKLMSRLAAKQATIGVIGLGYVGLPLAVEFAKAGLTVIGVDQSAEKVGLINSGKNYIADVAGAELLSVVRKKHLTATTDFSVLSKVDVAIICVPTPLDNNKQPDISYIKTVSDKLAKTVRQGQLIILESTTYPGTTEDVILPQLSGSSLKAGRDFFLAFSPERVDPGNKQFKTSNIPKVVGGLTPACARLAECLYRTIIPHVHLVSSPRVAEMEKLLENIFRSVNIALVNELAILCKKMDIDIWEVIEAAKTKPYGFMPFYPGPGLGGHCIPLDPFYLSWKAKEFEMNTRFIELAGEINDRMPEYVVRLVQDGLNQHQKSLKGASILVLGVAYKKDIDDVRESPALKILDILLTKEAKVEYNDPHVSQIKLNGKPLRSTSLSPARLKKTDCVVIVTDHTVYDYTDMAANSKLIIDTRNATSGIKRNIGKIIRI
jgi:UDP-N-acetyl-D-glucosamine dehydrogenase